MSNLPAQEFDDSSSDSSGARLTDSSSDRGIRVPSTDSSSDSEEIFRLYRPIDRPETPEESNPRQNRPPPVDVRPIDRTETPEEPNPRQNRPPPVGYRPADPPEPRREPVIRHKAPPTIKLARRS
jgi:hypothetical protein